MLAMQLLQLLLLHHSYAIGGELILHESKTCPKIEKYKRNV